MSLDVGLVITFEKEGGKSDKGHEHGRVLFPGLCSANVAMLT